MAQRAQYAPLLRQIEAPLAPTLDQPRPEKPLAPAVQTAPAPSNPLAAPSRFDALFLKPGNIDTYLDFAASGKEDANFLVASALKNWTADKDKIPLELCEFLAYKSVLAYEDEKALRAHFKGGGWRGMKAESFEFFDTGKNGDTQGYGFVSGTTAFIAMRGTTSVDDWATDLSSALTTDKDIPAGTLKLIGSAEPRRHLGFASAWAHAAPKIEMWAEKVRKHHDAEEFCFTGHSLGGALALVGAHDFAKRNVGKIGGVITFAAPKVGGPEFTADYSQLGLSERTLRCESVEDLVTWAARHGDFENPGVSCLVDKRPMIAGMEVFWAALLGIAGWEKAKEAAQSGSGSGKKPDTDKKPETDKNPDTDKKPAPSAKPDGKPAETKPAPDSKGGFGIILGIALAAVVFFIGRRIIIRYRAHGVGKRYSLFFSTHAYRRIRDLRIADITKATDAELAAATKDFETHLRYMRGNEAGVKSYKELTNRPIRVLTQKQVQDLFKKTRETEGDKGGYHQYFW
jgi:Lipase (class 3)